MAALSAAGAVLGVFPSSVGVFRMSLRIPGKGFVFSAGAEVAYGVSTATSLKSLRSFVTRKVPAFTAHLGLL